MYAAGKTFNRQSNDAVWCITKTVRNGKARLAIRSPRKDINHHITSQGIELGPNTIAWPLVDIGILRLADTNDIEAVSEVSQHVRAYVAPSPRAGKQTFSMA
jgi:hypothetical protein